MDFDPNEILERLDRIEKSLGCRGLLDKPEEPEILTAEDFLYGRLDKKYKFFSTKTKQMSREMLAFTFNEGDKNGQRRRDADYKELIEAFDEPFCVSSTVKWHAKVVTALQNIKPLEEG